MKRISKWKEMPNCVAANCYCGAFVFLRRHLTFENRFGQQTASSFEHSIMKKASTPKILLDSLFLRMLKKKSLTPNNIFVLPNYNISLEAFSHIKQLLLDTTDILYKF